MTLTDKLKFFEEVFGKGRLSSNGKNFDVKCPICNPLDSSKKKLSIRTTDDACHCWVCGWKSRTLAPLIRKYGSQNNMNRYKDLFGLGSSNMVSAEIVETQKLELPKDFKMLVFADDNDPDVKAIWRYIFSRKLDEKDAWYFKFGCSNEHRWKRRVIVPSFDFEGKLNYFVARAIDSNKKPKYDNPDVDKNPIIFNEINVDWTKRLVLVEGAFDLMMCPENSTALLGSDLDERHELFNKILLNNTPVALALDGDMWYSKTPKIAKKLAEYDIDTVVVDVREWGDPGKMSKIMFEEVLADAKPYNWFDSFNLKLEKAMQSKRLF